MYKFIKNSLTFQTDKRWLLRITLSALLGFLLTASAFFNFYPLGLTFSFGTIGGFIVGLFFTLFYLIDRQTYRLEKKIKFLNSELKAIHGVQSQVKLPLNLRGWSISTEFLETLIRQIYTNKPDLIVECGSGTSTVVAASCLKEIGKGKIISLDHEKHYAEKTRNLLKAEGVQDYSTVIHAPLKKHKLMNTEYLWYDFSPSSHLASTIDMLVVDGPPGNLKNLSRYPAVPLLKEYLSDDIIVMLDDTQRSDEQKISASWKKELKLNSLRIDGKHDFDILTSEQNF